MAATASPFLTFKEAAARARLSVPTLERRMKDPVPPPFRKVGGRLLIHVDALDAWVLGAPAPQVGSAVA